MERAYEFRRELNQVHRPNRRDQAASPSSNEIEVCNGWHIVISEDASDFVIRAAKDFQDYLFTSMNVSVLLQRGGDTGDNCIVIRIKSDTKKTAKSYTLEVKTSGIFITAVDERGAAQACYYLEDLMNLKEAPFLALGKINREPVFSPRMTHSGWGLDNFPDAHLNAIAHAGMDAILIFTSGLDKVRMGYLDFNDTIERAASFGLDVYLYSDIMSIRHPDDADAAEYYESTYGKIFEKCPGVKGVIFVGESCEFPSHDPCTTGVIGDRHEAGIRPKKIRPGWWPCCDFPQWLTLLRDTIRSHSPQADIVFWTYNWGYADEKDRIGLINAIPTDVTLLVTYEMFETDVNNGIRSVCMDYSINQVGPGHVFVSEAKAAQKRNIRLYTMCNTGGMTWDFGVIPYMPVPQQWEKRHFSLLNCNRKWNLSGLMESHHYGLFPSFISELAKRHFWKPLPEPGAILKQIAVRDFGEKAAPHALKAWEHWSQCCADIPASNEDQYGPARIGPSYPMIFIPDITRDFQSQEITMPAAPYAHNGAFIVRTFYHPYENLQQSSGAKRYPVEIKMLTRAHKRWLLGVAEISKALELAPEGKKDHAAKMLGMGKFIANSIVTIIHCKQWWLLNQKLLLESNTTKALRLLDQIEDLAKAEIANAEATIPLVEADSRLGWEPTTEYMTDREHLEWKIRQVRSTIEHDIADFRKIVK